jgi:hypothetical protein
VQGRLPMVLYALAAPDPDSLSVAVPPRCRNGAAPHILKSSYSVCTRALGIFLEQGSVTVSHMGTVDRPARR